jgi:arylsulfatase
MTKPFKGIIDLDVRKSVPDWAPFEQPKAPEGASNVLFIVWDDTGFGALEPFGGPIEAPTLRWLADGGCGTPSSTQRVDGPQTDDAEPGRCHR